MEKKKIHNCLKIYTGYMCVCIFIWIRIHIKCIKYTRIIYLILYANAYEWYVETSFGIWRKENIEHRFLPHPPYFSFTGAYLLWPYLSGRDAHFVMMSDLYRVDDLIIIGSDVPHQLLVLSIIPQEPFHFPCTQNKNK